MDFEVIVKYNGDILRLQDELNVIVEILSPIYAIISSKEKESFNKLLSYPEIEFIEEPFILKTQDSQSFSSTGITSFKNSTNLTGHNTLIGIIDSGIDYNLPTFRDENGSSKIVYYWDQSIIGNPPEGFKGGTLYTRDDINKAIQGEIYIPVSTTATHGTHVAGICTQIANKAELIVVRVGSIQTDTFSRSTEFMRAIKFILDKALELKKPVAINISYGSNEGSHRGLSLFEQYIDDMSIFWKNSIVIASGNNANKGAHQNIQLRDEKIEVEFAIGENERIININIWPNFVDKMGIYLVSPSNQRTETLSLNNNTINNTLSQTTVNGFFYDIEPYSLKRRVTFELKSNQRIDFGIWKIVFEPYDIVVGNIDIYLPTSEGLTKETKFLNPTIKLTTTVPGTAQNAITVGSFNSRTGNVSIFSGEGDFNSCVFKPDLLAPGEDIVSTLPGGTVGSLTGTSMATPHVTGVCSLLMEWGIVNKNDLFLYSQKLKSFLLSSARRERNRIYPNNSYGYGKLDLFNFDIKSFIDEIKVNSLYRDNTVFNEPIIRGITINHSLGFDDELYLLPKDFKYEKIKISDTITTMLIDDNNYKHIFDLLNLKSVKRLIPLINMNLLGTITQGTLEGVIENEALGVNFLTENPNLQITGKGVLIAIIDTGIDYLHQDFIYEDGTSKIKFLWDQTKDGKPPKGYYIGTEYTNDDINKAIMENDSSLSTDEVGSGTMLSGICAGLGNINPLYKGVARDAELIVVKLAKINDEYNNSMFFAANEYVYKKSLELNMPLCINISLGSNSLVGSDSEFFFKDSFFKRGFFISAAAGNDVNKQLHTSGDIPTVGETKVIQFELDEDLDDIEVQLWVERPYNVELLLESPSGEVSKNAQLSNFNQVKGIFDFEQTKYLITYTYPTTFSGQQFTSIILKKPKKGIWKIILVGIYKSFGIYNVIYNEFGKYNMYIVNDKSGKVRFREVDPFYTVNFPAVSQYIMTVGGYNTINNSIWINSSRGPNIQNIKKPDIVAPSVNIISTFPKNKYAKITGTSAANSYVVGASALYLQYTYNNDIYKDKSYPQIIATYMQAGAKRDSTNIYPNNSLGYGLLDIRGFFDAVK